MRAPALALLLALHASAAAAQSQPTVPAVNSPVAASALAVIQRQVSPPLDATAGLVTWSFPAAFANQPTCWESIAATNTSYSFDVPIVSAISLTSVTVKLSAHPSSLSITSLGLPIALPLTMAPPAGTTVTLSCVGALP